MFVKILSHPGHGVSAQYECKWSSLEFVEDASPLVSQAPLIVTDWWGVTSF